MTTHDTGIQVVAFRDDVGTKKDQKEAAEAIKSSQCVMCSRLTHSRVGTLGKVGTFGNVWYFLCEKCYMAYLKIDVHRMVLRLIYKQRN